MKTDKIIVENGTSYTLFLRLLVDDDDTLNVVVVRHMPIEPAARCRYGQAVKFPMTGDILACIGEHGPRYRVVNQTREKIFVRTREDKSLGAYVFNITVEGN